MPKENWRSVTLKEETLEKLRALNVVPSNTSVQEMLEHVVLVIQNWRRSNIWENWSKTSDEVETRRFQIETHKD